MVKSLTAVLLLISCITYSQVQLKPSKNIVDAKWLKNEVYNTKWYMFRDTGYVEVGSLKVTMKVKNAVNKIYIISEKHMDYDSGKLSRDSSIMNLSDLGPVYYSVHNPGRDVVLHYGNGKVTGYYKYAGKDAILINDSTKGEYFDPNVYPTILRWTALKEDFTAELLVYNFNTHEVVKAQLKKVEPLKEGNTNIWKLSVEDETLKGVKFRYYIDQQTRKLLRVEAESGQVKLLVIAE